MAASGLGRGGVKHRAHTPGMGCLNGHPLDYMSTHSRWTLGLTLVGWILWGAFSLEYAVARYLWGCTLVMDAVGVDNPDTDPGSVGILDGLQMGAAWSGQLWGGLWGCAPPGVDLPG